jgi:hypothetical protein
MGTERMTEERYAELRDMDREWDREEQGEMCAEAYIARAAEARLLKETEEKDGLLRELVLGPAPTAWRAGSPHGFSRVYAETEGQARRLGAIAQRCPESEVVVVRWPEEDLTTTRSASVALAEKGAQIKALADALMLTGGLVSGEWHDEECAHARIVLEHGECTDACAQKREALRLAGRLP